MATGTDNPTALEALTAASSVVSGDATDDLMNAVGADSSSATAPGGATGDTGQETGVNTPGAPADASNLPPAQGPPVVAGTREAPEPRIVAATRNAREKAIAEVEARLGWAKDFNPDDVRGALALIQEMRQNPREFATRLTRELGLSVQEPVKEKPWEMPEPQLRSEDGKGAYSDSQVRDIVQAVESRILNRVQPLFESHERATAREQLAQRVEQEKERGNAALAELRTLPHFKEHESDIAAKLQSFTREQRQRFGPIGCLQMAFNQVLAEKVFPTITSDAEKKVRDDNARKAATSRGSASPIGGGSGTVPTLKDGDIDGLARHMERLLASAG